mgnify:CR=1 FL=1
MGTTVTTRVDDELARGIDFFADEEKVDRSTMTRKLLSRALEQEMIDYALEKYRKGEITIGKAAETAKKDIREMMMIASRRGLAFQYSLKDLKEDFESAR